MNRRPCGLVVRTAGFQSAGGGFNSPQGQMFGLGDLPLIIGMLVLAAFAGWLIHIDFTRKH